MSPGYVWAGKTGRPPKDALYGPESVSVDAEVLVPDWSSQFVVIVYSVVVLVEFQEKTAFHPVFLLLGTACCSAIVVSLADL